jgi:PleD family two-component response regulator
VVIDGRFIRASNDGSKRPAGRIGPYVVSGKIKAAATPKRVLVVEDNLDSVHTLAYLLKDMGHTIEYAINGYVAVDVARRFRPDFVLLGYLVRPVETKVLEDLLGDLLGQK